MQRNTHFSLPAAALLAAALGWSAAPAHAATVFNDTFDVGDPPTRNDDAADPEDLQWYEDNDASLSVVDDAAGIGSANALNVDNNRFTGQLGASFATQLLSAVGDALTLSFDFRRLSSGTPSGSSPSFRFGLYDDGGSPLSGDSTGALSNTADDNGYLVVLNVGPDSNAAVFRETAGSNGILGGGFGDNGLTVASTSDFPGFSTTDPHEILFTLTRLSDGVNVQVDVDGTTILEGIDIGTDPDTGTQEGLFITEFDVIGFGIGSTNVQYDYRLDNIRLEFSAANTPTPIPVPGAVWLGLAGLGMLGGARAGRKLRRRAA